MHQQKMLVTMQHFKEVLVKEIESCYNAPIGYTAHGVLSRRGRGNRMWERGCHENPHHVACSSRKSVLNLKNVFTVQYC